LEHYRLKKELLPPPAQVNTGRRDNSSPTLGAYSCWRHGQAMLSGLLQKDKPFRKLTRQMLDLVLLPDEDGVDYYLARLYEQEGIYKPDLADVRQLEKRIKGEELRNFGVTPWGTVDYMGELRKLSEVLDMDLEDCARRYGTVTLPENSQGWRFHPALGFTEVK
jgi:CRISPR-associated endonuclease/helicase Cas3